MVRGKVVLLVVLLAALVVALAPGAALAAPDDAGASPARGAAAHHTAVHRTGAGLTARGASGAPSNVSATHAFIAAEYAFARTTKANFPTMRKQMAAEKRRILAQCPHAAAGSPQDKQSYQLAYEATGTLWSTGYGADAKPIATLYRAVHRIRWQSAKLARLAGAFVRSLHLLATLKMPPLCADIASWKASDYTTVPARTKSFDRYAEAIEITPVPRRLLAPYERHSDAALLARTEHLRVELLNFETVIGGGDWYSLLDGLHLFN